MTRGSQTSAFPPKLASHNRRPLDPKDNKGLQFGTNIHTRAASPSATHSPQSGKISSAHCRDRQTVAKASNQSSRSLSRRTSEPGFPSSQGRWVLAPRNQPSEPQLTHCPAPLQNGGYQDCEGTYEKRRLANKARSEGYLSFSANESATHTPSEGSMAEPNISVRHTSFRALQRPLRFHKAPQAGSGNFEKVGNQGCSLLRQHADHGKLQGGSPSPPSNSNASLDRSGIYPQPRQECSNTHSERDFLGVLPGFTYHADLLTNSQDSVHTTPDQRDPSPRRSRGNHSQVIPTAGLNGIHSSSSSSSPTALPPLGESQDNGTKTQSQLQHCSDNMRQDLTCRWLQELPRHSGRLMQWDMVIESDASTLGWGASLNNTSTGRSWTPQERSHHINYLELLAAFLALKTFVTNTHNKAILLKLDNVTAIAFLNRMGGRIQRHFAIWQYTFGNGAWRGIYSSMQNTSPGS